MGRMRRAAGAALAAAVLSAASSAGASGGGESAPWYLDQYGGPRADRLRVDDGRLGLVMARSPRPQLYVAWRLLHGLAVGHAAGEALAVPCCDGAADTPHTDGGAAGAGPSGVNAWLAARKLVPSAPELTRVETERELKAYVVVPNCFPDAFDTAAATLKSRAAAHGAASPEIAAWLAMQDAVFLGCAGKAVTPPAPPASAPAWLRADRAYQQAALALYVGRSDEAAERFTAIGRDPASPWRGKATYLVARARLRAARDRGGPELYARARAAVDALAAAPAGTYGQADTADLRRIIDYRDKPDALMARLDRELNRAAPPADVEVAFRDYANLGDRATAKPDALDWMATLLPEGRPDPSAIPGEPAERDGSQQTAVAAALAHARDRWAASRDPAWLLAALSLIDPGAPGSAALEADAEKVAPASPAWITARHHLIRLTIASADPARTRARADEVLARKDLSPGDRNVFTAWRAQAASSPADFLRFALRRRVCAAEDDGCVRDRWASGSYAPSAVYDGAGAQGTVGLGEDARAVIDRLPLAERIALGRDPQVPGQLRLDLALTSFARAVQLQDDAAADGLARDLATLLPQLGADWRAIPAAGPGPDKRFAEFYVLAKIPGLRVDLVTLERPEGKVSEFQQYWTDWIIPARTGPSPPTRAPGLARYQQDGYGVGRDDADARTDLACLGECGKGTAPLHPPAFAAALQGRAAAERARLISTEHAFDKPAPPAPPGAVAAWDEMLAYVDAHPKDARAPEALYWLVHVGRYGGSHDHSGRRAFKLLHARYDGTTWAKKTPYFYD